MIFRQFWSTKHQIVKNTVIASVVVIAATLFLYFYKFGGDITGFFRIGSVLPLSPYLKDQHVLVHQGEVGYDGQQFLSIALDPSLQSQGSIEALDSPRYRYRRILYPLLSYLLGFGNPDLIPYVLVGINCLCIILLVFFIGLNMHKYNQRVWQSLLVLVVPGVWIILSFSTADLLSSLLLAIAIYCYRSNRTIFTSISLSLACLTREPMLLIWLGFLLTSIWERKRKQMLHLFWAWIPPVAWNIYVLSRFSSQGTSGIRENFGLPLAGILYKISTLATNGLGAKSFFEAYSFALLIAMFVAIIVITRQRLKDNRVIIASAIAYSLMFAFSSKTILQYFLDYSRVYIDVYLLLLLSISSRHYLKTILMAFSSLMTITFLLAHS